MSRWDREGGAVPEEYDARWERLAAAGQDPHGEATLVAGLLGGRGDACVLDAGCGTGRVAIELARRGLAVAGVDLDPKLLDRARAKAPELQWVHGDLTRVELDRRFDVIVMAGNVMIFVEPGTEATVVANLARHLAPGGHLVAGFQLRPGGLTADDYAAAASAAGLVAVARYATWDRDPWVAGGDYVVAVHAAPA
jgi:SAM-dependent methyltransferase